MAKFSLLNALGLSGSAALQQDATFKDILPQFADLANVPLNQIALSNAGLDLKFNQPLALPVPGLSLAITAGASGMLRVLRPGLHVLDPDDPFSTVPIEKNEVFLQLGLELSAGAEVCALQLPSFLR
jgi:hypothetical protein